MTGVVIATEDALSEVVAETLLYQAGRRDIRARVGKKGFGHLTSCVPLGAVTGQSNIPPVCRGPCGAFESCCHRMEE